jgi:hypothetical protein
VFERGVGTLEQPQLRPVWLDRLHVVQSSNSIAIRFAAVDLSDRRQWRRRTAILAEDRSRRRGTGVALSRSWSHAPPSSRSR